jgi:hypothetical protein
MRLTIATYLIRTNWIGMLFGLVGLLLNVIAIGILTWLVTAIWYLVRCVKGLVLLVRDEPMVLPTATRGGGEEYGVGFANALTMPAHRHVEHRDAMSRLKPDGGAAEAG